MPRPCTCCAAADKTLRSSPDVILTHGHIGLSELLGSNITVHDMPSRGIRPLCTIKISDEESRHFYLVIEPPLPYFVSCLLWATRDARR